MPVILDTHVLLGALISSYGPPDALYRAWRAGRFEWVTSTAQLEAIRRASRYPKLRAILTAHRVGTMVNHRRRGLVLTPLSVLPGDIQVDDPDDAFLLAMAAASEADYLVTGDRRAGLLSRENIGRTRIVTPAGFRDAVL